MIFADDIEIYVSILPSELDHGIDLIAHNVWVIACYASDNGHKLNLAKSKAIILGSRAFVSQIDTSTLACISVDSTALVFFSEVRNLSVVISSNLSWRRHVFSISRRVYFSLHRLRYHRNVLSREVRSPLVTSLIFPILDYCCLVYNDLSELNELNTKLQQRIKGGIRFIFDLRRDVHISSYRRSLGLLTVRSRRLYFLGIATFNIMQGSLPPYLRDLFNRSVPCSTLASPHPECICYPQFPYLNLSKFILPVCHLFLALAPWYCSRLTHHWDPQWLSIQALVWPRV